MRFKIDWAIHIVGSKFTVFALFYFVFEGIFPNTSPQGGIFGGTYIWRGLFSEFYGMLTVVARVPRLFLYISKPSLHDCDMEHPNFTAPA